MAIRRSLSWARLKGEEIRPRFFPPKTKAGRRVIQIPDELVAALKLWKLQCPKSMKSWYFRCPRGAALPRSALADAFLPRARSRTPAPSDIPLASPQLRLSHDRGRRSYHRGSESARP